MKRKYYEKGDKKKFFSRKIEKQVYNRFKKFLSLGESKNYYYKKALDEGKDKFFYTKDKIFSTSTLKDYRANTFRFMSCINEKYPNKNFKDINQFEKHVIEYLKDMESRGLSAWTIQSYHSALVKFYQKDFDYTPPKRERDTIKRSRGGNRNSRFSEKLNKELVTFAKSTGLRRRELQRLRKEDFYQDNKGNYYVYVKGSGSAKGGRERTVPVYANEQEIKIIKGLINRTLDNGLVFGRIKEQAPIHHYRSIYAKRVYGKNKRDINTINKRDKYIMRKGERAGEIYDKSAVSLVTKYLGHSPNRYDVAVVNYLF